jgi:hypothetical protein
VETPRAVGWRRGPGQQPPQRRVAHVAHRLVDAGGSVTNVPSRRADLVVRHETAAAAADRFSREAPRTPSVAATAGPYTRGRPVRTVAVGGAPAGAPTGWPLRWAG